MEERTFIGREKELATLHAAYDEASTGKGKLVLVAGNAGIGKSGLVREFLKQIDQKPNVLTGISECDDKENLNAYAPFKNILVELNSKAFDSTGKLSTGDRMKKMKKFISDSGAGWIGLIPLVGDFIETGIDTYKNYQDVYNKKPESNIESENDIYRVFENEFRRLAKDKTIVIFIDDLQWADASSLNLIFALGKTIRANPFNILLIGSYRPFEIKAGRIKPTETGVTKVRHPFADKLNELRNYSKKENHITGNDNWFKEIAMKPLSRDEIVNLTNTRFKNNQFKPEFFDNIYNLTDGQPLYIVEMLEYLLRNGTIENSNGTYTAKELKMTKLPVSVDAIITEKIERLDEVLKKVLSYASVNGEEFAVQVIEKILKIDELDLYDYLEDLRDKHGLLIHEDPTKVKDMLLEFYRFSKTLEHKYIYEKMDGGRRRTLHRRIAGIIEEIYGDDIETNKEIKASYNLHKQIGQGLIDGVSLQMIKTESGSTKEAAPKADVFIEAAITEIQYAKDSYEQFAMDECYDFVNKALAFLSKVDDGNTDKQLQKFEALLLRNKAEHWQGHYKKAKDTALIMEGIAKKLLLPEYIAQANLCIAKASTDMGDGNLVLHYLEQAVEIYEKAGNKEMLWEAYIQTGQTKLAAYAYDDAILYYEKAAKLADELINEDKKAEAIRGLGKCYSSKQEDDKAIDYFNKALSIFEKSNDIYKIGIIYNNIGMALLGKSDFKKARDYFEKSLEIAKDQNDHVGISYYISNIGLVSELEGDYDTALEYYKKSLAIHEGLDDKPMMASSFNSIGDVYDTKRDFTTAFEYFNKALDIAETLNDKGVLASTYSYFGKTYRSMKKTGKAIEYYKKSLEINKKLDRKLSIAIDYNSLGVAYDNDDNIELATEYYNKAGEYFELVGDKVSLAAINNNLAGVFSSNGDNKKAIEYYEKCMVVYNEVDNKLSQSLTGGNLASCYTLLEEYDKAIELLKKPIAIAESINEKAHIANHYSRLFDALYGAKRYEESISIIKKAIPINEEINNPEDVASNYNKIGDSLHMLEKYNEAIVNYQLSLKMRVDLFGEEHKDVATTCVDIGYSYHDNKQYDQAIPNYEKALAIRIKLNGEDHEDVAKVYVNLMKMLQRYM